MHLITASELIAVDFLFTFALCHFNSDLIAIFLEGCEILTSFTKLSPFDALTNIQKCESPLRIQEVELVASA